MSEIYEVKFIGTDTKKKIEEPYEEKSFAGK